MKFRITESSTAEDGSTVFKLESYYRSPGAMRSPAFMISTFRYNADRSVSVFEQLTYGMTTRPEEVTLDQHTEHLMVVGHIRSAIKRHQNMNPIDVARVVATVASSSKLSHKAYS